MILSYIAGPVLGAIIGYCTNYIAVKMLFYPKKEVKIGGKRLPFTPGVIPKGKDRMALAVGDVVGNKLITPDDLEEKLLNEEVCARLAGVLASKMSITVREGVSRFADFSDDEYLQSREELVDSMSGIAVDVIENMDIGGYLSDKGTSMIMDSIKNPMLSMFLTPDFIKSILGPMGDKLKKAIAEDKDILIRPALSNKVNELEDLKIADIAKSMNFSEAELEEKLAFAILNVMRENIGSILEQINIEKIVSDKIREIDIDDLENMVLKVMKEELDTIVNLGALIGFIIGLLMIVIK